MHLIEVLRSNVNRIIIQLLTKSCFYNKSEYLYLLLLICKSNMNMQLKIPNFFLFKNFNLFTQCCIKQWYRTVLAWSFIGGTFLINRFITYWNMLSKLPTHCLLSDIRTLLYTDNKMWACTNHFNNSYTSTQLHIGTFVR